MQPGGKSQGQSSPGILRHIRVFFELGPRSSLDSRPGGWGFLVVTFLSIREFLHLSHRILLFLRLFCSIIAAKRLLYHLLQRGSLLLLRKRTANDATYHKRCAFAVWYPQSGYYTTFYSAVRSFCSAKEPPTMPHTTNAARQALFVYSSTHSSSGGGSPAHTAHRHPSPA